jgi:hypothetical protein
LAAVSGCASDTSSVDFGPAESGLRRAESCDDLLDHLRADAAAKVRAEGQRMLEEYRAYQDGEWRWAEDVLFGVPTPTTDVPPPAAGPTQFTQTNTQVAGVDEPDFVKTDGQRVFVIHGQQLFQLDSWPAAETAIAGRVNVEGQPTSMFLRDDTVVVFSSVQFMQEGEPRPSGPAIGALPFPAEPWGDYYPYSYRNFTKVSVFDVSGATPTLREARYVEGHYRAARRHDDVVRLVLRSDTWQPQWNGERPTFWDSAGGTIGQAAFRRQVNAWVAARLAEIDTQALDAWLPEEWVQEGDALVAVAPRCSAGRLISRIASASRLRPLGRRSKILSW